MAAQSQLQVTSITTKDGLSGDIVYSLFQDSKGFLWIGTHRGLNRYDGYNFRHYINDPDDSSTISSNHVHCISEDKQGLLWLSTVNGLNSLNPSTGEIKRFFPPDKALSNDLRDIMVVNDSILLIMSPSGVYKFNKATLSFRLVNMPFKFSYWHAWKKFAKNKAGEIFTTSDADSIIKIDYVNNKGNMIPARVLSGDFSNQPIQTIYFDQDDLPWAIYQKQDKLIIHPGLKSQISPYKTHPVSISLTSNFFYEDNNACIWTYTRHGLVMLNKKIKKFFHFKHEPGNPYSLSNNWVTSLLCDKNGVYWAGTFGNGVCRFQLNNGSFNHINLPTYEYSNSSLVSRLETLNSEKIIGAIDNRSGFYLTPDHRIEPLEISPSSFPSRFFETTGIKWQELPKKEKGFLTGFKKYLSLTYTAGLIKDKNKRIWVAAIDSLFNSDTTVYFRLEYLVINEQNNFLFTSQTGLYLFNTRTYQISEPAKSAGHYDLTGKHCKSIIESGNGIYWIATGSDGLVYWNSHTQFLRQYTTRDGLPDNSLYMILPDKKGRLWISTNNGLSCFDTTTKTFTNFTIADGLINSEYNSGAACVGPNGYMYFGGMTGIDYFHPDSITGNKNPPGLILSLFKIFDRPKPLQTSYQLATEENSISFEFTSNDFLAAKKIFYRYKLTGADNDWVILQGSNSATYNKLPPGSYQFVVQASFDNKKWGETLYTDIVIATPWYRTWWFFTLVLVLLIFGAYLLFRYRLNQKLKVFTVRQRLHRDLHDDVGATLSSVKAYSEILKDNPNNPVIAELIKDNSAEMIERLEVIAWATNPVHDNFLSLKNKMMKFAVPLCHANKVDCSIESTDINDGLQVPGEIRQNIFLIFKEAVNNCLKYAEASSINSKMFIQNRNFIVQITDDGKGSNGEIKGSGTGWMNMRKRAEELKGSLDIKSLPQNGTTISVSLPYPFKIPNSWDKNHAKY